MPDQPQGVLARASMVRAIVIRWLPVAGAAGYVLERSETGSEDSFTLLAKVAGEVNSFRDTNLALRKTFYYRVKATAEGAASAYSLTVSATTNPDEIIRIMPLGDSNTDGGAGTVDQADRIGYRKELYRGLREQEGYKIDLVGSEQSGESHQVEGGLVYDLDHAGFGGFRNRDLVEIIERGFAYRWYDDKRFGLEMEENYLQHFSPDIILLHSGTNDLSNDGVDNSQSAIDDLEKVLAAIEAYEASSGRDVTVILAKIIKSVCNESFCYRGEQKYTRNDITDFYNAKMEALADTRRSNGDNILLVDMAEAGLVYDWDGRGDMADALHPNQVGYDKMAQVWLDVLASPAVPLPVELKSFHAAKSATGVLLEWETASEVNNDRFEVERKLENEPFTLLGAVPGAGDSQLPLKYTFRDVGLPEGQVYYRLRQVDTDGTFSYSKVVAVHSKRTTAPTARLYPNLVTGSEELNLTIGGLEEHAPVSVALVNSTGKSLSQQTMQTGGQGGLRENFRLPPNMPKGMYFIELRAPGHVQRLKLLVR
ncbi:SGNH/GDSL hydrolase family protein [Pontibacter litorisediminis]|uniref:SGNH/GDSL hydrolase family protein n=1 Tax=Pontibacter litorisediminis TaxID=1846260 RepID=UPI0023ECA5A8|nr:SGNH/GDSL hydrolase family protein [Pontibacter litorisediminis]